MYKLPSKVKDYSGKVVGLSEVISFVRLEDAGNNKKRALWKCRCKCGNIHFKYAGKLAASIRKGFLIAICLSKFIQIENFPSPIPYT